ncbi:hypothetical protein [Fusibacter sp. JL216-2]|uniref:hypothetical protein n=1 Tax=Fusibacter sp. JL216-2 TaxID=3071453 RepID=UPI003D324FA4
MGLSTKKSKIVKLDELEYKWLVSTGSKINLLLIEANDNRKSILEVEFESDIDRYWVEFPEVDDLNRFVVKPYHVKRIIKMAEKLGWKHQYCHRIKCKSTFKEDELTELVPSNW